MTRDVDGEPLRTMARRRRCFVDLPRWYLDHHTDNKVARRRTHLDVIIGVDDAPTRRPRRTRRRHVGRREDDGPPRLRRPPAPRHHGPSSTILDYGRRTHIVPHGLREALNVRDRHCRFSDCDRPPAWCEAHHIVDWELGGPTRPDNLVLLCSRHHHILHLDGWKHCFHPDNTLEVVTPSGRRLEPHAQSGSRGTVQPTSRPSRTARVTEAVPNRSRTSSSAASRAVPL